MKNFAYFCTRKLAAKINMKEIWKEINGYEGSFEVSNLGNFRSKDRKVPCRWGGFRNYPGKTLKTETIVEGYQRIVLMKNAVKKRYMCHRLVAQTFIPNPNNKPFINHKNGNKADNRVCNLEWCTQSENELHSHIQLGNTMKGKTYPRRVKCLSTNIEYKSMSELIREIGNSACIEGLKKAIKSARLYHGKQYSFI